MSSSTNSPYKVLVSKAARRDLKRLHKTLSKKQFARLDSKIQSLANNPRPPGCEDMEGMLNAYRVRDGNYRIIYVVDDDAKEVKVGRVRDRKDVYRH